MCNSLRETLLNHRLGETDPRGDLSLAQSFMAEQQDNRLIARWQLRDDLLDPLAQCLALDLRLRRVVRILEHLKLAVVRPTVGRQSPAALLVNEIPGNAIEISLRIGYEIRPAHPKQAKEGLLGELLGVILICQPSPQVLI